MTIPDAAAGPVRDRRLAAAGVTAVGLIWVLVALLAIAGVWPASADPRRDDVAAFAELFLAAWLATDDGGSGLAAFGDARSLAAGGGGRYATRTAVTSATAHGDDWIVTVLADLLTAGTGEYHPAGPATYRVRITAAEAGLAAVAPPRPTPTGWPGAHSPAAPVPGVPQTDAPQTDAPPDDPGRTGGSHDKETR